MLKMVHGGNDEKNLLPMVRYAQETGNDAICKAVILSHLGEPDCPDVQAVKRANADATTVLRDIGVHARTLVQLLDVRTQEGKDMTLNMLVKDWRSTSASAPQWYVSCLFPSSKMLLTLLRLLIQCAGQPTGKRRPVSGRL